MKEPELPLPENPDRPTRLEVSGWDFHATIRKLEAQGATVAGFGTVTATNGFWWIQIRWPDETARH